MIQSALALSGEYTVSSRDFWLKNICPETSHEESAFFTHSEKEMLLVKHLNT